MARIRSRREAGWRRCEGAGWRRASQSILAGPAQGSNSVTVRKLMLDAEGATPRRNYSGMRIASILSGSILLMDGDGATHLLQEGDTVIIDPDERHHFVNGGSSPASLILIDLQSGS